jgi:BCD family chlorophyll transporter-like MFS transporter
MPQYLGWFGIVRLGLVQMSLGGIIVLATSPFNRVVVKELGLPATLFGLLIGLHYAAEMLRPRWGYGSDKGGLRTPWVIGGMAVLAMSVIAAAASIALMSTNTALGIAGAVLSYIGVGVGAGAAGTSLIVLIAKLTSPARKPAAAAFVWTMMIAGTAISAITYGKLIDPFSMDRLISVSSAISAFCLALSVIAIWGIERSAASNQNELEKRAASFIEAVREVWSEPQARRMTVFIFVSMLAFSAQEVLLEPFAATAFKWTPGETGALFGTHRAGIVMGMALGAIIGSLGRKYSVAARFWVAGGCLASAFGLFALASVGFSGVAGLLKAVVFSLGVANGVYAVAAIGTMMSLANAGKGAREGTRLGIWGAAQGTAFGLGAVAGPVAVDLTQLSMGLGSGAYALLFLVQGALFIVSTGLAARLIPSISLESQDGTPELSFNTSAQAVGEAGARMT